MDDTPATGRTKRALRALAADRDSTRDHERPRDVIREATDALSHVETATRFLAADGATRLARAVVRAVRADDDRTVRQGRETLAALRSLQSALDGPDDSVDWPAPGHLLHPVGGPPATDESSTTDGLSATDGSSTTDESPVASPTGRRDLGNHFHPARGTVLGAAGKRGDR